MDMEQISEDVVLFENEMPDDGGKALRMDILLSFIGICVIDGVWEILRWINVFG